MDHDNRNDYRDEQPSMAEPPNMEQFRALMAAVLDEVFAELARELTPTQIVELVVALAVAGMGQRWINTTTAFADYAEVAA